MPSLVELPDAGIEPASPELQAASLRSELSGSPIQNKKFKKLFILKNMLLPGIYPPSWSSTPSTMTVWQFEL